MVYLSIKRPAGGRLTGPPVHLFDRPAFASKASSMSIRFCSLFSLFLCGGLFAGCGPRSGLDLPTGTVSGTVTSAGKPLTDATITFFGETVGDTAMSPLQADGSYTLKYGKGFSVPVGDYRVAITSGSSVVSGSAPNPEDLMKTVNAGSLADSAIPAKYTNPETSGLIAIVKEGTNSSVDFDLK
ncbi:MAG: carboxypeptidase-like regulatory domain-containing protein [Planctomycetaceae bacterium]